MCRNWNVCITGIVLLLFVPATAIARGGGGHGGGGFGGGGFHGGGMGGGYHGNAAIGGNRTFAGHPQSNFGHSFDHAGIQHYRAMSPPVSSWRHTQAWNHWGVGEPWRYGPHYGYRYYGGGWPGYWPFYLPGWYDWGWYSEPYYFNGGYETPWPPVQYENSEVTYPATVAAVAPEDVSDTQEASVGEEYARQAREKFREGDYREALRLASHAAVELPQDPSVHELISLTLFAQKDYYGAAAEAHASLQFGPPIDWPTLLSYYDNVETYTTQLRALEAFVEANPKKQEGRFLLGYHYVMTGYKDAAKRELAAAMAESPHDKLTEELIKQLDASHASH